MNDVIVLDYDPNWPQVFEALRSSIWSVVSDIAISVEHVGSTSVPGLAAKPVIDMDVVVREGNVAEGIVRLSTIGYGHQGDLGVAGREAFRVPPDSPRHHLYLCPESSPAFANHVAIRDYLRADTIAARAYGDLKMRLAREYPDDINGYGEAKTDFLVGVLRKVSFPADALADIERMNARP